MYAEQDANFSSHLSRSSLAFIDRFQKYLRL